MTDREQEIQARCEAATTSPWRFDPDSEDFYSPAKRDLNEVSIAQAGKCACGQDNQIGIKIRLEDVDFITHAREDVPYLLSETARLRAELDEMKVDYKVALIDLGEANEKLTAMTADLDAAQRRASAAVRDISQVCDTCKHDLEDDEISAEICGACGRDTKWEWRGPDAPSKEAQP